MIYLQYFLFVCSFFMFFENKSINNGIKTCISDTHTRCPMWNYACGRLRGQNMQFFPLETSISKIKEYKKCVKRSLLRSLVRQSYYFHIIHIHTYGTVEMNAARLLVNSPWCSYMLNWSYLIFPFEVEVYKCQRHRVDCILKKNGPTAFLIKFARYCSYSLFWLCFVAQM